MELRDLYEQLRLHPAIGVLRERLGANKRPATHILLAGLNGSAASIVLRALAEKAEPRTDSPILLIADNADEAQYLFGDLRSLEANVFFFPVSHRRRQQRDEAMVIQRTEVLAALSQGGDCIIVTYPEALTETVPARDQLQGSSFALDEGQTQSIGQLADRLTELNFQRVDFVYEPGQYAIRGGIVDIYSYAHEDPYRLDFFGDEIDSIRTFDIETQLSDERCKHIEIVATQPEEAEAKPTYLTDYLSQDTLWCSNDWNVVFYKWAEQKPDLSQSSTLEWRDKSYFPTHERITFDTLPQPVFNKDFSLLTQDINRLHEAGYRIYILSDQKKQADRLQAILDAEAEGSGKEAVRLIPVNRTLHAGWIDHDAKCACYTDHQIFERYHRVTLTSENARRGKAMLTLKEINQLQPGDYVVHSDHGIGLFGGLVTTAVNGKLQEMLKLNYRDGDTIFVSIHNLHRIAKYKGKEGTEPTISKLGSGAWERLKERTKSKVKDIARELIQLYAKRKSLGGFAYPPDDYMQHELEASFIYEDTIDQAKATLDVKHDLESHEPMDRLICGDVGFGKTEVAMRAAFKVATSGKQTAVLVPTTVLALQHYNTFRERFRQFPVRVEYLSRTKSPKEVKDILDRLQRGEIDILIGTHKLVGKQVKWKDLGLLIIDEEQKFGVSVKEKLKSLRANVDVLTLTATPIPRTLQFSLLGARDLSVINTAPPNRFPVQTEIIGIEDEDIIKEAIDIELQRNGQIFVVSNRIEMLPRIEARIHRLCPDARIITAHGQMPGDETEKRLEAFINYDYDVLVSTTIIESGVDIPNVNTMIIYSAQNYGLADLHQLRGRVGRSNRKAYCYLVTPDRELLTPEARRRLDALSIFAEPGSGFNLAMQDLDIRGAGNLLGAEQSGFIADLGYETYQRILNEAVEELKEEEGVPTNDDDDNLRINHKTAWCSDSQLETDIPVSFPNTYIENIPERIALYRELDSLRNEDEMTEFKRRLIDRFGPLPEEAEELMNVVRIRWVCCQLGIEKIHLKGERMALYLQSKNPAYLHSDALHRIVDYVRMHLDRCQFHEVVDRKGKSTGKKYITITNVRTLQGALNLLNKICNLSE